jgi:septation ring formation regulator EzrA
MPVVMIIIILIIIFSIGIISRNIKRKIKNIEELEHRLDKYYKEREQRLKDKGLIK